MESRVRLIERWGKRGVRRSYDEVKNVVFAVIWKVYVLR